ncbi:glycine/betaine ABC transporter ATP-binding protein [Niastella yeongjuensis]|uniref:Glycine/betaine ABC transporter ATP-binding protein n=1 Tax=Niastella yeongjuensis TaxID=354355 RepID=A0A1V9E3N7_9BACT|nr:ABC transporter ATP-binding protein [Niastella yeongjuensis]OQP40743.1 glycine/betaine ABC transporter ATP-binding protein [Niastella yeongjuensis]SEP02989.1 osmoprotectant transport system ATP-binding protein [Niastella yeongjuensis]
MISIQQVTKMYGPKFAVDQLSMEIAQGEHLALLGASGSGKTTLLRMINRLIEPTCGTITINGEDLTTQPAHLLRRDIGFVLQANSLFPHYTVEENISVVPNLLKWDQQKTQARVTELLDKVHLPAAYRNRYPHQLSGGEGQRVNLARALAANPPVLLMDEPFSALDNITRTAIRQLFKELEELKSKTIIMVTHDVQEAFEMGDSIALLQNGKLLQKGKPADLLYHPANEAVKEFLAGSYLSLALAATPAEEIWQWLADKNNKRS